ncbi:unnamed protein product [Oikopleura dioica]|uniref:Uncharacterized protein n=1 Tax=Oikopleura dioica TaxID=34765 RepID=E4WT93_OIKDI|nr:unnamed protein product [Oikopleura dioica]
MKSSSERVGNLILRALSIEKKTFLENAIRDLTTEIILQSQCLTRRYNKKIVFTIVVGAAAVGKKRLIRERDLLLKRARKNFEKGKFLTTRKEQRWERTSQNLIRRPSTNFLKKQSSRPKKFVTGMMASSRIVRLAN